MSSRRRLRSTRLLKNHKDDAIKVEGYDSKVDKTDLKLRFAAQSGAFTVTNTLLT